MNRFFELKNIVAVAALAAFATLSPTAQAASVYGETADLTGTRSEPAEILAFGDWAGAPLSSVSWDISDNGDGTWHYEYTFTADLTTPGISHFILTLSDSCVNDPDCVLNANSGFEIGTYDDASQGGSNPGLSESIFGVKFGEGNFFEFDSNRDPVWGNFYVKGGSDSYAYNAGLLDLDSMDVLDFVARPNGGGGDTPDVPEPSTVLLMGGSLLALAYFKKRRNS